MPMPDFGESYLSTRLENSALELVVKHDVEK